MPTPRAHYITSQWLNYDGWWVIKSVVWPHNTTICDPSASYIITLVWIPSLPLEYDIIYGWPPTPIHVLVHCAGKGVFTTSRRKKGEFLTFYTGELISEDEALRRESVYTVSDGSFVFFFKHGRRKLWLVILTHKFMSRVPCTKVLSQEIQIFQETSFCVLQVLLTNFTNTIWQLYTDFYTIRIVFGSSFQLFIFKVANLKKLRQFWQKMCR